MTYFIGEFFADSAIMYEYLELLTLKTGNERSGTKFFNRTKAMNCYSQEKPESMKCGHTWKKFRGPPKLDLQREWDDKVGLYKTVLLSTNPWLMDMFNEYSKLYFPNHKWTEITINKMPTGSSAKQHLDKVNSGDSVLVAFGDYSGGNTYIKRTDNRNYDVCDCRVEPQTFNGSQRLHGVSTITSGKRYSLVFYNTKLKKKMKQY